MDGVGSGLWVWPVCVSTGVCVCMYARAGIGVCSGLMPGGQGHSQDLQVTIVWLGLRTEGHF